MSLAGFDENKLRKELSNNYKPPPKNINKAMSNLGVMSNFFTNKIKLEKLKKQAKNLLSIEKSILENNPELNNTIFMGDDKEECAKKLLEKYLGKGVEVTRNNIKEALKKWSQEKNKIINNLNNRIERIINNSTTNEFNSKPFDPKNFDKLHKQTIFAMLDAYRRGNADFENIYNQQKNILKGDKNALEQLNSMYSKIKRGNKINNFVNVSKIHNIDLLFLTRNIARGINDTDVYKLYSSRNNNGKYNQIKNELNAKYSKNKKTIVKIDNYIKLAKQISIDAPNLLKSKEDSENIKKLIVSRVLEDIKKFKKIIKKLILNNRPKYEENSKSLINYEGFDELLKVYEILYTTNRNKNSKIYKLLNIKNFISETSKKYKIQPMVLSALADGVLYLDKDKLNKSYNFVEKEFDKFLNLLKFIVSRNKNVPNSVHKYGKLKEHLDKFIVFEQGDIFYDHLEKLIKIRNNENIIGNKGEFGAHKYFTQSVDSTIKVDFFKRLKIVKTELNSLIF